MVSCAFVIRGTLGAKPAERKRGSSFLRAFRLSFRPMIPSPTIVRSKKRKRTVALHVEADGTLTVMAPMRTSLSWINAFIAQKTAWIARRQKAQAEKRQCPPLVLQDGCLIPFLGQELRVVVQTEPPLKRHRETLQGRGDPQRDQSPDNESSLLNMDCRAPQTGLAMTAIEGTPPAFPVTVPEGLSSQDLHAEIKTELTLWYKRQARHVFQQRAAAWAERMGVSPARLIVTAPKRRWGSCSAKDEIRLNWRLIMLPDELLDYVIVHELCHIPHKNHGKRFWKMVGDFIPQVSEKRQAIRKYDKSPFFLLFAE